MRSIKIVLGCRMLPQFYGELVWNSPNYKTSYSSFPLPPPSNQLLQLHAFCGTFSSFPVVIPSSQIRSAVWVTHSPIFCSVFLFLQLLCSNRSNDDRLQWKQRFDSFSRGVQCSHRGGRAGMTHWSSCVLASAVDKKLETTRKGAVLATVQATSAAFRDVTPWCSVSVVHCFEKTYYLHLQGLILDPPTFETGGIRSTFFRNVGETLPDCHIFTSHRKINPEVFRGFTRFLNPTDGIINSIAFWYSLAVWVNQRLRSCVICRREV
jgi:hypothetical protein